ncbi:HGGxSTG domain-containing protein [Noviherbaspirillum galbum]|uniref:HGGxSTG domain-containing protein n=1 Tax=Noviherbaspirillum galbum TaxID=2709383 RepID=UPI002E2DA0FC|nr:HGGxSTG domain-containing protein [Noviherbaspirillum galbum]
MTDKHHRKDGLSSGTDTTDCPRVVHARDERATPICGARNRQGLPCQCKKLYRSGRCRFHGGLSTGPKRKKSV